MQSYFRVPKYVRINSTNYLIMKVPNKQELQQITFNHLSGNGLEDLMNLYKKCTAKPDSLLVIDSALSSDIPLRCRRNLLERI